MNLSGPSLAHPVRLTRVLDAGLAAGADTPALISTESRWSFRALDAAAAQLATGLLDLGLSPGDRVASLMPNSPELLVHYLACLRAGLVATPLNYRYAVPEIDHSLQTSDAALLLCASERRAEIERSTVAARLPRGIVWHGDAGRAERRLRDLLERPGARPLAAPSPDTPAFIFFTSGSTGLPKGVTHTHATFGWMVASCAAAFEFQPGEVVLPATSLSHVAAILFTLAALSVGGRAVVARRFEGDELLPLLRGERPAALIMLPAALMSLVRDHDARREDFASVKICICGGDKVSAELEREYLQLTGSMIDEGYGMTEIGMATRNPIGGPIREGSVGTVCPGFEMALRDDDGREVEPGGDGRLWARAPSTMVRYWNAPEATAEVLRDGWLDTGDVMRADADGYLWFRGRKKQLIIHDGSNIAPQEVEEALLEHPGVESAGVIGIDNLLHGETVRGYVVPRDPARRPSAQELIAFVRTRIAAYKAPEEIVFLDAMPLNATGKVDRAQLKRMVEEGAQPQR
jgi:acyl-CoA synthetase (AMP-forming)/AMP-acid ligase II